METPQIGYNGSRSAFISWQASSWHEAVDVSKKMDGWLFRGQSNADWDLTTSIERAAKAFGFPQIDLRKQEEEILNQFKRQAHQYLSDLPPPNANLEWLSLIQHHGGATRLLDFTRSFYVGAFFAIEGAEQNAAIWAINERSLNGTFIRRTDLIPEGNHAPTLAATKTRCVERCIKRSFGPPPDPADQFLAEDLGVDRPDPDPILDQPNVIATKPWRLNQRLIVQQGWFLFPTSLEKSFETNVCGALGVKGDTLPVKTPVQGVDELKSMIDNPGSKLALVKITFPRDIHLEAMRDLRRMNITAATLFPGLDGFARSLKFSLRDGDELGGG